LKTILTASNLDFESFERAAPRSEFPDMISVGVNYLGTKADHAMVSGWQDDPATPGLLLKILKK
jgi:hypothetical protein